MKNGEFEVGDRVVLNGHKAGLCGLWFDGAVTIQDEWLNRKVGLIVTKLTGIHIWVRPEEPRSNDPAVYVHRSEVDHAPRASKAAPAGAVTSHNIPDAELQVQITETHRMVLITPAGSPARQALESHMSLLMRIQAYRAQQDDADGLVWKDIESAPRLPGQKIVAFSNESCLVSWEGNLWWDSDNSIKRDPTHWLCVVPDEPGRWKK